MKTSNQLSEDLGRPTGLSMTALALLLRRAATGHEEWANEYIKRERVAAARNSMREVNRLEDLIAVHQSAERELRSALLRRTLRAIAPVVCRALVRLFMKLPTFKIRDSDGNPSNHEAVHIIHVRALERENIALRSALGNLVDAVNVEFHGGINIGGKTGPALIHAVDALASGERSAVSHAGRTEPGTTL